MKMKLSTKKILTLFAIVDAAALGAYAYGIETLAGQNSRIADLAAQVNGYSVTNDTLSTLQSSLASAEKGMKEIDEYYVPSGGVVDFITMIELLAKQSGLAVSVDSVDAADVNADTKDFQERITLRLATSGTWTDTEQFLSLLESLPYNVSLSGIDLTKMDPSGKSASSTPSWKGEFALSALKLK